MAPPPVAPISRRPGYLSSHPAKAIMAMPMVTSPKRPICSTKAMFSTRSVPIGSAGACTMTGTPTSAASAKKESARGEPSSSPCTLEVVIRPTKAGSASVSRTPSRWSSSPNGFAYTYPRSWSGNSVIRPDIHAWKPRSRSRGCL